MTDPWAAFPDAPVTPPAVQATGGDPWAAFPDQPHDAAPSPGAKQEPAGLIDYVKDRFNNPPAEPSLIGMAGQAWRGIKDAADLGSGKIDPSTPEGSLHGVNAASTFLPTSPATGTWRGVARVAEGRSAPPAVIPDGVRAATTATELGAPLPIGVASDSKAVQGLTQAARQLPIVGATIDKKVADTVSAAGQQVNQLASNMTGGVTDRASSGAIVRPSLQGVIEDNNGKIDTMYSTLRNVIDPEAVTEIPRTGKVLDAILKDRMSAGQTNPQAGLEDVANLVNQGASFNGLQRARSDIGNSINFGTANPGFNKGDMKRLYAAMSSDMDGVVRANAARGVTGDQASRVLQAANAAASQLIEHNKGIQSLLSVKTDEGMMGSLIGKANDKTGDVRTLAQLSRTMPKEDFQHISGVALSELGHNPTTGEFSLAKFASGWEKMGDRAKAVMFPDQGHRTFLNDIAALGQKLKGGDQYRNSSNTGRANAVADIIKIGAGGAAALATQGEVMPLLGLAMAGVGGHLLAKALARPATAATVARWMRAAHGYDSSPSIAKKTTVVLATRNMINTLGGPDAFTRLLESPMKAAADNDSGQPTVNRQANGDKGGNPKGAGQ